MLAIKQEHLPTLLQATAMLTSLATTTADDVEMSNYEVRKTARDLMWENGGPGVWAPDYREQYGLKGREMEV